MKVTHEGYELCVSREYGGKTKQVPVHTRIYRSGGRTFKLEAQFGSGCYASARQDGGVRLSMLGTNGWSSLGVEATGIHAEGNPHMVYLTDEARITEWKHICERAEVYLAALTED